jgi:hypothetical protein
VTQLYGPAVGLHVTLVIAGTVGLAVTTGYLLVGARAPGSPAVQRFFRAGIGIAPRLLYPAALFGAVAAATSDGRIHPGRFWVWGAGTFWLGAALLIETVVRSAADKGRFTTGAAAAAGALGLVLASSALMVGRI